MGYIRHNAIVCTSGLEKVAEIAHKKAIKVFDGKVTSLVEGLTNQYFSFMVVPDGSKEGWEDSDDFDKRRNKFIKWLETHTLEEIDNTYKGTKVSECLDYVEISFGGDNGGANIIRASE